MAGSVSYIMAFPAEDIHILMKVQKKKEEPYGKKECGSEQLA